MTVAAFKTWCCTVLYISLKERIPIRKVFCEAMRIRVRRAGLRQWVEQSELNTLWKMCVALGFNLDCLSNFTGQDRWSYTTKVYNLCYDLLTCIQLTEFLFLIFLICIFHVFLVTLHPSHNFRSWKKRILFIFILFVISTSHSIPSYLLAENYLFMHGKISIVCLKKFHRMWRKLPTYMLYFLVYLADVASGYSMGAPDAACSDMTPGHQHRPQVKHFNIVSGPDPDWVRILLSQWVWIRGVKKRCRLSLLTNSALVIQVQSGGRGWVAWSQPMSTAVHITWHGAQINFGDLFPYLTYGLDPGRSKWACPKRKK